MPESPDFDQIALSLIECAEHGRLHAETQSKAVTQVALVEQLRQVWNARGAADLTALEYIIGKLGDTMDPDNARVFVSDALRSLDR